MGVIEKLVLRPILLLNFAGTLLPATMSNRIVVLVCCSPPAVFSYTPALSQTLRSALGRNVVREMERKEGEKYAYVTGPGLNGVSAFANPQ